MYSNVIFNSTLIYKKKKHIIFPRLTIHIEISLKQTAFIFVTIPYHNITSKLKKQKQKKHLHLFVFKLLTIEIFKVDNFFTLGKDGMRFIKKN